MHVILFNSLYDNTIIGVELKTYKFFVAYKLIKQAPWTIMLFFNSLRTSESPITEENFTNMFGFTLHEMPSETSARTLCVEAFEYLGIKVPEEAIQIITIYNAFQRGEIYYTLEQIRKHGAKACQLYSTE